MKATAFDLMRSPKREISSELHDFFFQRIHVLFLSVSVALQKWIPSKSSYGLKLDQFVCHITLKLSCVCPI